MLGVRETITITAGTVIGVGLFTVGANVVGIMGSSVILATLAAMAISIYPALLYAEMGASLPVAGGTYRYAALGLGRPFGMLAGWNFIISMVSVASGEALAFSFYLRMLLEAFGITLPFSEKFLALGAVVLFLVLGIRGIETTGRLQNGFLFFFWGVAVVWVLSMLPHLSFENFSGGFLGQSGPSGFLSCVALVWWCFAGFETCCAMGEEIKYPQINLPRALFLAPFLVFAVNGLFQWVLVCTVPSGRLAALAEAAAPYAEGMQYAGVVGFPLILLCLGIAFGGDFSTLNASVTAPARYLYTMAKDGVVPKCFGRLHCKYCTPAVSIVALGLLMIALISTGSIAYIASLSLFATLLYYVIGIAAACGLRVKHPNMKRPYRAPAIWVGSAVSIFIYLIMMTQLEKTAIIGGIVWCALGILAYGISRRRKTAEISLEIPDLPDSPSAEEKQKMDREYRVWQIVVAAAVAIVLFLFLAGFLAHR